MTTEEESVRVLAEAYRRWENMPPVVVAMDRTDMYAVVMAAQAMLTYPDAPPSFLRRWEAIGRQFQAVVCDDAALYTMTELGWDRTFDVEGDDHKDQAAATEQAREVWPEAEGFERVTGGWTFRVGAGYASVTDTGRVARDPQGTRRYAQRFMRPAEDQRDQAPAVTAPRSACADCRTPITCEDNGFDLDRCP